MCRPTKELCIRLRRRLAPFWPTHCKSYPPDECIAHSSPVQRPRRTAAFAAASADNTCAVKLKFHESSFLARISACQSKSPFSLPRAYLTGRPAVCCGVVLPVSPCVVSFSKFHEPETHDLLQTSSRECYEKNKMLPRNFSLNLDDCKGGCAMTI